MGRKGPMAPKIIAVVAVALLVATWLWPPWYEYSAVAEGKWFSTGYHFALTYRSDLGYPLKIDWGRVIVLDLAIAGPSAALVILLARKRGAKDYINGLN